ncbi:MAG: hypothetical protein IPK79_05135 [Vampirovibrionales bacterium]|nr:hypothetical protein [Vampirovibrionales bacterium]
MSVTLMRSRPALFFMTLMKDGQRMRDLTRAVFHAPQQAVFAWARGLCPARRNDIPVSRRRPLNCADSWRAPDLASTTGSVEADCRQAASAAVLKPAARRPASRAIPRQTLAPAAVCSRQTPRAALSPTQVLQRWLTRKTFWRRHHAMTGRDGRIALLDDVCGAAFTNTSAMQRRRRLERMLRPRNERKRDPWRATQANRRSDGGRFWRFALTPASSQSVDAPSAAARYLHDRSPPQKLPRAAFLKRG